MKFNFKKISAIGSSILLAGMSVAAPIAAANYPAPFIVGGSANVAIVYGSGAGAMDSAATANIGSDLQSYLSGGSSGSGGSVTGGDSLLLAKSSDNMNLGDTWSGVFVGSITHDDLTTLLAKGTYVADDNDEFDYEQKITLGAPVLTHFRDSDYEALIGSSGTKTPSIGFKLNSSEFVMNYTLDFLSGVVSTVTGTSSGGDLTDIEGSDILLLGKTYYVSDFKNGTAAAFTGKLTLLDSANQAEVSEGETKTVKVGDKSYDVSITFIDSANVKFLVNGQTVPPSGKLAVGGTTKLADGAYLGVRDVSKLQVAGEIGSAGFSIGTGKLELTHGADIRLNGDTTINNMKAFMYKSVSGDDTKLDKIEIEWRVDEEQYLTPEFELLMPGFEAVKFSMNPLVRSVEEKVVIEKSDNQKFRLTVPIKDGTVTIPLLYGNSSGEFTGIGESNTEQLATSSGNTLLFEEKDGSGNDLHKWFVASYNITGQAESYYLRAKVTQNTNNNRNETTIDKFANGGWVEVCAGKTIADTCNIGDVTLTFTDMNHTSAGAERVLFTAGTNVNFETIWTAGGLQIQLPVDSANASTADGAINFTASLASDGYNWDKWYLFMHSEDKDDNTLSGTEFNFTLDDTSTNKFEVTEVNHIGTGGATGLENEVITDAAYEYYVVEDVSTRIVHFTNSDEDHVEVYYATGDSETYAEVYLAEAGATITAGAQASAGSSAKLGDVYVTDKEVSSVITKELVIIGGSCINSAAATALGVTYPTCGSDFTTATGIGAGEFLVKGVADKFATGKLALVVAGYNAADTSNAVSWLTKNTVDTSAEYKSDSTTTASMVVTQT